MSAPADRQERGSAAAASSQSPDPAAQTPAPASLPRAATAGLGSAGGLAHATPPGSPTPAAL